MLKTSKVCNRTFLPIVKARTQPSIGKVKNAFCLMSYRTSIWALNRELTFRPITIQIYKSGALAIIVPSIDHFFSLAENIMGTLCSPLSRITVAAMALLSVENQKASSSAAALNSILGSHPRIHLTEDTGLRLQQKNFLTPILTYTLGTSTVCTLLIIM